MPELIVRREGATGWILLSNPAKHNAVTYEMLRALPDAVAKHERDMAVRVIAITGQGSEHFVSGTDISEFAAIRGSHYATGSYGQALEGAYEAFAACRKPTLAKIRGACVGVGLSLALCCDLRMASDDALFRHPGARYGLGVYWGTIHRLVAFVGPGQAAEIFFAARRIYAQDALRIGLANRVVAQGDLDREFAAYCAEIAAGAPLTHAAAKRAIIESLKDPAARDLKTLQAMVDACHASDDYKEGLAALRDKRKPQFRGR